MHVWPQVSTVAYVVMDRTGVLGASHQRSGYCSVAFTLLMPSDVVQLSIAYSSSALGAAQSTTCSQAADVHMSICKQRA